MFRNEKKKDIVLELALAGAFAGSHRDYFLHETTELIELIDAGIISRSVLNSCFNLTEVARPLIIPRLFVKKHCKLPQYCRDKPMEDLSVLELVAALKQKGWIDELKAPGARIAPYSGVRSRKVWCRLPNKPVSRYYLMGLLSAAQLLEKGLPTLVHLQSDWYYRSALYCLASDRENLKNIYPNKPVKYYQQILGYKTKAGQAKGSEAALETDMSIYDQLALRNKPETAEVEGSNEGNTEASSVLHVYRRLYIRQQDLEAYGYSNNCDACDAIQASQSRAGIYHSESCRERIMRSLEKSTAGRQRLAELKEREELYLRSVAETDDSVFALTGTAKRQKKHKSKTMLLGDGVCLGLKWGSMSRTKVFLSNIFLSIMVYCEYNGPVSEFELFDE